MQSTATNTAAIAANTRIETHTDASINYNSTTAFWELDVSNKHLQVNGRSVTALAIVASSDAMHGDLAVVWDAEDDSNYVHNSSMLMRDMQDSNNNTDTMGQFYWEHAFDDTLCELLIEAGFSAAAAADVCGSEWGMQDVGRASYDANLIAEEVLSSVNVAVAEEY